jgi:hypothetical protein
MRRRCNRPIIGANFQDDNELGTVRPLTGKPGFLRIADTRTQTRVYY